ncbi:MAG: SPFH domain-containing protein [Solobacterium sp.]|nr:SPFH domain-containing protein [Solobacterium sp.]
MDFKSLIRGQFLDTIEYEDLSNRIIVYKYVRPSGDNEIKQGSKVIVRESQAAIFLCKGQLADVFKPGTWTLNTENLPVLSSMSAVGHLFNSPIKADLYFISTKQFTGNKWATKNPVILRDPELNMVRVRSFGQYSFRVVDPELFMKEVFGTKGLVLTWDIVQYLSGLISEAFATVLASAELSVLDLAAQYKLIGSMIRDEVNQTAEGIGIEFSNVLVENFSLPDEVEKLIDEQSGIGMANKDMNTFMQYQAARSMRDASKQKGGLAGLGAGMAAGNKMVSVFNQATGSDTDDNSIEKLRQLKMLLDEGILTQEEFDLKKKQILKL